MLLHKDEFPVTIQAYEMKGDVEYFIAEQLVNNQNEVDTFSKRYAGKLIKVKAASNAQTTTTSTAGHRRKSSATTILIVILILLAILVAIGFYTGWIQRTFGIDL